MIVGGIIPEQDVADLLQAGVAAVYTPKDFDITRIMREIVALLAAEAERPALAAGSARLGVSPDGAALGSAPARARPGRRAGSAEPAREQRPADRVQADALLASALSRRRSAARRRGT